MLSSEISVARLIAFHAAIVDMADKRDEELDRD
jgi:hypothetical protein